MFDYLASSFSHIFKKITGNTVLNEKNIRQTIDQVRDALLEADVPYQVVETFTDNLQKEILGQKLFSHLKPAEQLVKIVHEQLVHFLGGVSDEDTYTFAPGGIWMMVGLQGSGKTTSIAKLAYWLQRKKKASMLFVSVDFQRPAAITQLKILADQVGADFFQARSQNPIHAAQETSAYIKTTKFDQVFFDTAGRLQVDEPLMRQLREVKAIISPTHTLLVLDAMTGQHSLSVASVFEKAIGFDAAIMSKVDSGARSGASFAFRYELKKPILFTGTGEKSADLELFRPERMADRILGMGDLMTLVEKAHEKIKHSDQERIEKSYTSGRFSLQDFVDQLEMVGKLGSIGSIMKLMPQVGQGPLSETQIEQSQNTFVAMKSIILSMTPQERLQYRLIDSSRKKRIARGSGRTPAEVTDLLNRFEQMQQYVKLFKKMGGFSGF